MHTVDETLNELITAGTRQGHLKFSQIFNYLPNEAVSPEKLDNLLMAIDDLNMEIVTDDESLTSYEKKKKKQNLKKVI